MSRRVSLLYFSDALALPLLDHPASARAQMSQSPDVDTVNLATATSSSYGNILYIDIVLYVCMYVSTLIWIYMEIYSIIRDTKKVTPCVHSVFITARRYLEVLQKTSDFS